MDEFCVDVFQRIHTTSIKVIELKSLVWFVSKEMGTTLMNGKFSSPGQFELPSILQSFDVQLHILNLL